MGSGEIMHLKVLRSSRIKMGLSPVPGCCLRVPPAMLLDNYAVPVFVYIVILSCRHYLTIRVFDLFPISI